MIKRILVVLAATVVYIFAVSAALIFLPFDATPNFVTALFAKKINAFLFWAKLRHFGVTIVVGGLIAWALVKQDAKRAQLNALLVGILSMLFGIFLRIHVAGGMSVGLVEITDYLTIGLAVPALVAAVRWKLSRRNGDSVSP
jgi:hypothetical protein